MQCARRAGWKRRNNLRRIVIRASPGGSILRVKDVARVELGAQTYNMMAR